MALSIAIALFGFLCVPALATPDDVVITLPTHTVNDSVIHRVLHGDGFKSGTAGGGFVELAKGLMVRCSQDEKRVMVEVIRRVSADASPVSTTCELPAGEVRVRVEFDGSMVEEEIRWSAMGTVMVSGCPATTLAGPGGSWTLPSDVPAGEYVVRLEGDGWEATEDVAVAVDAAAWSTVECIRHDGRVIVRDWTPEDGRERFHPISPRETIRRLLDSAGATDVH